MTESTESQEQPAGDTPQRPAAEAPSPHEQRYDQPNRLNQALAWVGIVAGVLFIVAAIFFSGLFIGRVGGGYYDWHRGYDAGQQSGGSMGSCPMKGPGGRMGHRGMNGPDSKMGPGGGMMGPGQMRPGEPSQRSPAPTTPQRP